MGESGKNGFNVEQCTGITVFYAAFPPTKYKLSYDVGKAAW
jgi:hypothetical protein